MAEEDTLHQTGISEKKENLIIEDLKEEKIGLAEANQKTLEETSKELNCTYYLCDITDSSQVKETVKNMRYVRNLTVNSGFEKLARSASLFAQMFKAIVEREDLAERNKAQAKIIEDKEKELKKVNQKFQLANYALDQKKYVDKGKTVLMGDPAIGAIVVIFAMLFGVIIYEMFPDIFPTLTNANWVGFGIACVLVYFGIRSIIKSKQKEQMKIQTEDTEVK